MNYPAWLCSALLVLPACGQASTSPPSPRGEGAEPAVGVAAAPVVYGTDGREDWYGVADPVLKAAARDSVAAMIPWGYLSSDETGAVLVDGDPTLGDTYQLCADQRFAEQPTAAVCSGTLIDDDLLLTAGHCVPDLGSCASAAWVFDYLYEADGVRAEIREDAVFRCIDVVVQPAVDLDEDLDLAIIQLDRPVGRQPAAVTPPGTLARGAALLLMGFPNGIPLKVDGSGSVGTTRTADYFIASVDAFYGNSGSGVRGADLGVLGVLVSGADDYVSAGTCSVVQVLDPGDAEEAVIFAHHALSSLCVRGYPSLALCGREGGQCGDGFCTDGESARTCRGDCDGLFAVPAEWSCDASWYDAGDECDCACGVLDPDCKNRDAPVLNCAPGSACLGDGSCELPVPEAWLCGRAFYGDGARCNCDCGVPDPDCADASLDESGCAPGGVCQSDGSCSISIAAGWECRRRFYGSGDGCDCGCGAFDPDCAEAGAVVYGCIPGTACLSDGSCEQPIPEGWRCGAEHYAAGDACDCNCGVYDPDCASAATVRNCGAGAACDADGGCAEATVEPDPEDEAEPAPEPEPEGAEPGPEAMPDELPEVDEAEPVEPEAAAEPEPATPDATEAPDVSDTSAAEPSERDTRGLVASGGGCAGGGAGGGAAGVMALWALLGRTRRQR